MRQPIGSTDHAAMPVCRQSDAPDPSASLVPDMPADRAKRAMGWRGGHRNVIFR